MGDLKLISEYSDSAMHWTPEDALREVLAELEDDPDYFDGVLIIRLRRKNGSFDVSRAVSKVRNSEAIAPCEIIKQKAMEDLL